jgi:hypothetical protein
MFACFVTSSEPHVGVDVGDVERLGRKCAGNKVGEKLTQSPWEDLNV